MTELERNAAELYPRLEQTAQRLTGALRSAAADAGIPLTVNQCGGVAHAFVTNGPVGAHADTLRADHAAYGRLAGLLLQEGVHVIPRGLLYVSAAHEDADMTLAEAAISRAMARAAAETAAA